MDRDRGFPIDPSEVLVQEEKTRPLSVLAFALGPLLSHATTFVPPEVVAHFLTFVPSEELRPLCSVSKIFRQAYVQRPLLLKFDDMTWSFGRMSPSPGRHTFFAEVRRVIQSTPRETPLVLDLRGSLFEEHEVHDLPEDFLAPIGARKMEIHLSLRLLAGLTKARVWSWNWPLPLLKALRSLPLAPSLRLDLHVFQLRAPEALLEEMEEDGASSSVHPTQTMDLLESFSPACETLSFRLPLEDVGATLEVLSLCKSLGVPHTKAVFLPLRRDACGEAPDALTISRSLALITPQLLPRCQAFVAPHQDTLRTLEKVFFHQLPQETPLKSSSLRLPIKFDISPGLWWREERESYETLSTVFLLHPASGPCDSPPPLISAEYYGEIPEPLGDVVKGFQF